MGTAHFLDLLKLGRPLQALIEFQENKKQSKNLSAREHAVRAEILSAMGETQAFRSDLRQALEIDNADQGILLSACRLGLDDLEQTGHELALKVIGSSFSVGKQRKTALGYVDANLLPAVVPCSLRVMDRVTVIHRLEEPVTIAGLKASDTIEYLGDKATKNGVLAATDYFFAKHQDVSRNIQFHSGSPSIQLEVEALATETCLQRPGSGDLPQAAPWIIIPVHDGGKVVERCLLSVVNELDQTPRARLLIINDCSRKPATLRMLERTAGHKHVSLISSDTNLGFVKATNLGLRSIGGGPVLLLNSDTYMPPKTLGRLLAHLQGDDVGTVTPLSNNAGSFSIPKPLTAHTMPNNENADELAELAYKQNAGVGVDVLNGNGFSMLISEHCLKDTGFLSSQFKGGYFEEVDFCLRAAEKGYRHLAAVDCFVAHVGSVSFKEEKKFLVNENRKLLASRYPNYHAQYERFALIDPLASYREKLTKEATWRPRKRARAQSDWRKTDCVVASGSKPILAITGIDRADEIAEFFPKLHLISKQALHVAGLRIDTRHEMNLHCDPDANYLYLQDAVGRQVAGLDLRDITYIELGQFEELILELVERLPRDVGV